MKNRVIIFVGILFFAYPTYAISNSFFCDVTSFSHTTQLDEGSNFVANNLKKKYLITTKEKNIIVSQIGDENEPNQRIFNIITNDKWGLTGLINNGLMWQIVFLSDKDDETISVTITILTFAFVNAWVLGCKKV